MTLLRLDSSAPDFDQALEDLLGRGSAGQSAELEFEARVREILDAVRSRGDAALLEFTRKFDGSEATSIEQLSLGRADMEAALAQIDATDREALTIAADRIRAYHQHQGWQDFEFEDELGNRLGQRVTPLQRAGFYVPGGQASYPSSVLMSVLPAQVAGVDEIVMVTPTPGGRSNPMVLAAAALAGVDRVFCIGGAQAVAALAYGTESVPSVDKIVGPGGAWVAAAKRLVFGTVGIDLIAGPSEIVVVSDGSVDPEWAVMDLFSQAEHDADAQAILISPDAGYLDAVQRRIEERLQTMERSEVIAESLASRGGLIHCGSLGEAVDLSNRIAPEHLELAVQNPDELLDGVRHAGAVFVGADTAEALGDYVAGPSHVLPTAGSARFSSPLSVYDFQKRASVIRCSPLGSGELARTAAVLARSEGLDAHARSAELRIRDFGDNDMPDVAGPR